MDDIKNTLIHGDYLNVVDDLPNNYYKLAILDPPYNVNADSWDNIPDYFNWMTKVLLKTQNKLTSDGALFLWGMSKNNDFLRLKLFMDESEDFNLQFRNWIVWVKEMKIYKQSDVKLPIKHEDLLFYSTKQHRINLIRDYPTETQLKIHKGKYNEDFFIERDKLPPSQQKIFKKGLQLGSQIKSWWKGKENTSAGKEKDLKKFMGYKPIWICDRMIEMCTETNDNVLIPFAGTGTECVSSKELNRNYTGIEISNERYEISKKRINDVPNNIVFKNKFW